MTPPFLPTVSLLVRTDSGFKWLPSTDIWRAMILFATASDDPRQWSDMAALWPRYRAGVVDESIDDLGFMDIEEKSVVGCLSREFPWLALDLTTHTVFASGNFDDVDRDFGWGVGPEDGFEEQHFVAIHLPPWWDLMRAASPQDVLANRDPQQVRLAARRDVVWGRPFCRTLAELCFNAYSNPETRTKIERKNRGDLHQVTVGVHREWLMTPRADLGGETPRDQLHKGRKWVENVIAAQEMRLFSGLPLIPLCDAMANLDDVPMGRTEVVLYFDACRDLLQLAWMMLATNPASRSAEQTIVGLEEVLSEGLDQWLATPFEGGSSPEFQIKVERQRVPLTSDMEAGQGHVIDCDCPICVMMNEGTFGPALCGVDGHQLELDEEFAFSLCETKKEWESERMLYDDDLELMEDEEDEEDEEIEVEDDDLLSLQRAGDEKGDDATRFSNSNLPASKPTVFHRDLESPWKQTFISDEPLPGDSFGHLTLAFRLAEIVDRLKVASGGDKAAVDRLNGAFRTYRVDSVQQPRKASLAFKNVVESVTKAYPELVAISADFQSKLDELARR